MNNVKILVNNIIQGDYTSILPLLDFLKENQCGELIRFQRCVGRLFCEVRGELHIRDKMKQLLAEKKPSELSIRRGQLVTLPEGTSMIGEYVGLTTSDIESLNEHRFASIERRVENFNKELEEVFVFHLYSVDDVVQTIEQIPMLLYTSV